MFEIGDKVGWTSQSGGFTKTKSGEVVRVLSKPDGAPLWVARKEFAEHRRMFDGLSIPGGARIGYFVEVRDGKTPRAKPKLYMPYPEMLEAIK